MRKKTPAILALILLFALGSLVLGCNRSETSSAESDVEQTETMEEEATDEAPVIDGDDSEATEDAEEEDAVTEEFTPGDGPKVVLETSQGNIVVELLPDIAPKHVANFEKLIGQEFYDGLTFHRYVPGFVIQGGDPEGTGMGGPGWKVPGEFGGKHIRGALAMARSAEPDSAGSQFYFVLDRASAAQLDGQYTVFGQIIEGLEAMDKLREGDVMSKVYMQGAQAE